MLKGDSNQMKRKLIQKRIFLVLLTFVMIFTSGIFMDDTEAEVISRGPELKQVGPINESNGFPIWYKDSNNVKLELCLDANNPYCGLVTDDFDPTRPISFPSNYPGEAFYQLAEASMSSADGRSDAIAVLGLEATFNGGVPQVNDQTVFGRIRFRVDSLVAGQTYRITHPYGVDEIIAEPADKKRPDGPGEIRYVEDIGAGQTFAGALKSSIGTFLKAVAPAPPAGYIGDPNVEQTVTGGVNGQNFLRIEGPGIGLVYPGFACGTNPDNCIETSLFTLSGKIATNEGLDIQQATYSQTAQGGAIDVFVSSETGENIVVSGNGIVETNLAGGNGQYYAHVPYSGTEPPKEITLTNTDDNPDTVRTIKLVDQITANAVYDTDKKELTITATSSDKVEPEPLILNVKGFGEIDATTGKLVISNLSYIPPTLTITSPKNGTVTIPVNINSIPVQPVTAFAGVDQTAKPGASVELNGLLSTGPIASYFWEPITAPEGVTLGEIVISDADKEKATFTAPETPGEYVFKLTVTGPNVSSTSTTTVTISGSDPGPEPDPIVSVNAGPDQTGIKQGTVVTLDGSGSQNATSYSWKQISGKSVTLNRANTANPTFTFPKQPEPVEFELTVTGPDGKTASKTVKISTVKDNLSVSVAEFRSRDNNWRIDGKSDVFGPGVQVTIYIVDLANKTSTKLGTATVDNLGDWRFRSSNSTLTIGQGQTLKIESTSGGTINNQTVTIRR